MNEVKKNKDQNKQIIKSILLFVGSFVFALSLTWLLKKHEFTDSQVYTIFLLFFSTSLWLTEAIPAFAVSLFIMAYLVFAMGNPYFNSAPEKIDKYVNTFSSSIIWLFLGGFFLSAAMTKTKIDQILLKLTLKISGTNPRNILIALMVTTTIASMLMSNTATTAMIVAALMPLLNSLGKSGISKALLLGVSIAATAGGLCTIIGSPPNAVAAGMLEKNDMGVSFLVWMIYGIPVAIILTSLGGWILIKKYIKTNEAISFSFLEEYKKDKTESPAKRKIVMVIMIVTVLLWLTSTFHGITVAAISAIPIVFLTLTGILTGDDMKSLPWDTLFLIAGSLSLGVALEFSGILNYFSAQLKAMHISNIALIFILAYISSIVANIMSNVGASAVLIPLGMAMLPGLERELTLSIGLSASMALFLPVSAPWNAIVYSTGLLDLKDFRIGGILVGILGPLLAVLWVLTLSNFL